MKNTARMLLLIALAGAIGAWTRSCTVQRCSKSPSFYLQGSRAECATRG